MCKGLACTFVLRGEITKEEEEENPFEFKPSKLTLFLKVRFGPHESVAEFEIAIRSVLKL